MITYLIYFAELIFLQLLNFKNVVKLIKFLYSNKYLFELII